MTTKRYALRGGIDILDNDGDVTSIIMPDTNAPRQYLLPDRDGILAIKDYPFSRPIRHQEVWEDWQGGDTRASIGFGTSVSGTGASAGLTSTNQDGDHPGVVGLSTGTTATGRAAIGTSDGSGNGTGFFLSGDIQLRMVVRVNAVQAVGTEEYFCRAGWTNSPNSSAVGATNGLWFGYSTTSNNWQVNSYLGGSLMATLTAESAVTATAWYTLDIAYNDTDGAECWVDGVSIGTIALANLPASTSLMGVGARIVKTVGVGTRVIYLDKLFYSRD